MRAEEPATIGGGFKWDGTINAGAIIAMIGIAFTVIGTGAVAMRRIDDLESTMEHQGQSFDARLKAVEESLVLLRVDAGRRESLEKQVMDHEARLRQMEAVR